MDVPNAWRIVLLGKSGAGRSSLANTIFGMDLFKVKNPFDSVASVCEAKSGSVNGRSITLMDTPGFMDPDRSEEELKPDILGCITECAPGPHAFLIVLKVEKFTEHEKDVIEKICQYFSEEALKYAAVVFTHGDQLPEGMKIEEFVSENEDLRDLMEKCSGRCHVVDNKYWKNNQRDEYRSNQLHVAELLYTVEKMMKENEGGCYTVKMLREWQAQQEQRMKPSSASLLSIFKYLMKCARRRPVRAVVGVAVALSVLFISKMMKTKAAAVEGAETHTFM
ncbi:GTPase IMAP family member 7-like isoform X2 [Trachinotus anak]|uniref:GTPase IMAP family member 7-like isoform X2 n=1 Tax=Trachinotus anak TaxID=443729 RepID=UPI0039F193E9